MSLTRRLARLEEARKPPRPLLPHILELRHDETKAEARARFEQRWGRPIPNGHQFIIVPAAIESEADEAEWERRFMAQQWALRGELRASRPIPKKEARTC